MGNRKYPHRTSRKGYIGLLEEEVSTNLTLNLNSFILPISVILKVLDFNQQKKGNLAADEEPDRAVMWHKARKGKNDEEVDPELAEKFERIVSI